jgi:hypothetical protein
MAARMVESGLTAPICVGRRAFAGDDFPQA